jgi:signal transduction histidine kinase
MKDELINKIINVSINFIAVVSFTLNLIIFFALHDSVYLFPRYIPPLLSAVVIFLLFFKSQMSIRLKTWTLIVLMFLAGCFTLLLGLLDMASLWFILALIFSLFVAKNREPLFVFTVSFVMILVTGFLMMAKVGFIPLDYKFQNCQFACVSIRIVHFLLIGFLIYYILHKFFFTITANINELQEKASELEKLNQSLQREMNEKREIQLRMLEAVILAEEKERKRIAGDLHDGLSPVLSAINLYYQAYIDAQGPGEKAEIETRLKEIIENAIDDVSRISHDISPHILESYGLITALENFISQLTHNESLRFAVNFEKIDRFDLKNELTVYRTITELINNTIKHGSATLISLDIEINAGLLKVKYEDNGKGFSVEEALNSRSGIGLKNIQNRIQSLNGTILFHSRKGAGMDVKIEMPCTFTKHG